MTERSLFPVTEVAQQVANAKIESVAFSHCQRTATIAAILTHGSESVNYHVSRRTQKASAPGNLTSAATYQHMQQNIPKDNEQQ